MRAFTSTFVAVAFAASTALSAAAVGIAVAEDTPWGFAAVTAEGEDTPWGPATTTGGADTPRD